MEAINPRNEKRKKRRTLGDVAREARVSAMTVSRVLSGNGVVSDKTRAHVREVANRLGYVPNRLAGSLATSRSNQVAVVIPSLINNVYPEVTAGIAEELEKAGYNPVVGISEYDIGREESLIRSMISWRPAGFIVSGLNRSENARNILENSSAPVVEIMELSDNPIDICVGLDQEKAGRVLAGYMLEGRYCRFGYLGFGDRNSAADKRLRGIRQVLGQHGLTIRNTIYCDRPPDMEMGKAGLARLLEETPDLDAVFFSNDMAALGGIIHCLEAGIDIPGQLAVAGFSGLSSGQIMPKKLTTIATRRYDVGRLGARAVINRLDGQEVERIVDLGFELIKGETA